MDNGIRWSGCSIEHGPATEEITYIPQASGPGTPVLACQECARRWLKGTGRTLLTIRVSRDSGKTWEPERTYAPVDGMAALMSSTWPPCQCPIHRPSADRLLAALRATNARSANRP